MCVMIEIIKYFFYTRDIDISKMKTNCNLSFIQFITALCSIYIYKDIYIFELSYVVKAGRDRSLVLFSTIANLELVAFSICVLIKLYAIYTLKLYIPER